MDNAGPADTHPVIHRDIGVQQRVGTNGASRADHTTRPDDTAFFDNGAHLNDRIGPYRGSGMHGFRGDHRRGQLTGTGR